jgi:hypothetical protein
MFYPVNWQLSSDILEEIKPLGWKNLITPNSWYIYISKVRNMQPITWAKIIATIHWSYFPGLQVAAWTLRAIFNFFHAYVACDMTVML